MEQQLQALPLTAWEDELPALDLVIRETLRLITIGGTYCRIVLEDFPLSGTVLKKGAFVVYPVGDVHSNPTAYADPLLFDPSRYEEERQEDKKGKFSYLGWGAGKISMTSGVLPIDLYIYAVVFEN